LKRVVIVAGGGVALAALSGCGGSPAAEYPGPAPGAAVGVEEAELELDALERSLGLIPPASPDAGAHETHGAVSPAQPGTDPAPLSTPRCETACDSLASMTRAASRVCALAGPGDRCAKAESRAARAREHVVRSCGECS
jgi:hypothetical protein